MEESMSKKEVSFWSRLGNVLRGKETLDPRELSIFKLAVWSTMLVWMVSFITIALFVALSLKTYALSLFGEGALGNVMAFLWAVSWVTTVLYTLFLMAKYTNKKMRGKRSE
jgi:uncharacterized membrane protein (DUF485 family)